MSKLQDDFNAIVAKIEERITDKDELDFIKQQIADISMLYIDELNKVIDLSEKKVSKVVENQRILERKMAEIENSMSTIEKELFVEDEYDFEITCPYCNYEFVTDINSNKTEITCPECHNTIELDWNHDEEHDCGGHCGGCGGCGHEENDDDYQENEQIEDNEDDM